MDKKNKGLVDNHDGDIILNESGTSVSFGWDEEEKDKDSSLREEYNQDYKNNRDNKNESSGNSNDQLISKL